MNDTQFEAVMGSLISSGVKLEKQERELQNIYAALYAKLAQETKINHQNFELLRNEMREVRETQLIILRLLNEDN